MVLHMQTEDRQNTDQGLALPHCDVQKWKSMLSKNSEFEHGLLGNYESTFVKVEGSTIFEHIVVLIIY